MLDDIQSGKVHTDYVLVFKLSRFGRNARDVLNSLEFIMKYGVHLMCVEDRLDFSTSMGKMMITILGAVAELERENIIAQSLLGRVAWGKRRTEKVPGKDNEYRLVKQDEYILSEVISHEAFVFKEDFDKVQEIKAIRGKKGNHNIGQYNAHLLSGIVKCPQCGAPMYIGMTKWTNQDGTERRRADMTRRLNDLYDQIYKAEDLLQESMMKKATLESEQMSVQSMIGILSSFDAIYDRMNAAERRDLVKYLISEVELFPREEQKTQKRFAKAIAYKFPIEQKVLTQFDECGSSVETVAQLTRI